MNERKSAINSRKRSKKEAWQTDRKKGRQILEFSKEE